jgi:hypothetical protein
LTNLWVFVGGTRSIRLPGLLGSSLVNFLLGLWVGTVAVVDELVENSDQTLVIGDPFGHGSQRTLLEVSSLLVERNHLAGLQL